MRSSSFKKLLVAIMVVVAFLAGWAAGSYRARLSLLTCKSQNRELAKDLANAVKRGVTVEAALNGCKEEQK